MNNAMEDLILFYREWILRLQIDCLLLVSSVSGKADKQMMQELYDRRISFLRKCIAYCKRQRYSQAEI